MLMNGSVMMQAIVWESAAAAAAGQDDDSILLQRARADRRGFAPLYRRYVDRIYRFHLLRTGNVDEAQELTSLTFLAALESLEGYQGRGSFAGWLFSIARHKLADFHRSRKLHLPLESANTLPHPEPAPDDLAARHLQLEEVIAALRRLAPEQAEALTLRVFGQLSAAEAGRIMGKSDTAVRMLVYRALQRLRQELDVGLEVS